MSKTKEAKKESYPECEKLQQVTNTHQTLHQFIEWLYDNGFYIKHQDRNSSINPDTTIYDFMGVDARELEKERRQILETASKL